MRYVNTNKFINWRIDEDGMLRVTARVLPEGVFEYLPEDSPEGTKTDEHGHCWHYIPRQQFTQESLKSLEGKPVIVADHVWRDTDNTLKDGLTVGTVAGAPKVDGKYIVADFVIYDKDAIAAIKQGKLIETSAAYDGDCTVQEGEFAGKHYNAIQSNLRFNHVLLLPEGKGRCGHDNRIVNSNSRKEINVMPTVIKKEFGNRRVDFAFQNEDDAKEAERMSEETATFNAAELEDAMKIANEVKAQLDELQKKYDDAMATVEAQKAEIDKLMSAETQEAMAQEAAAQKEAEEAIINACVENEVVEEAKREEVCNRIANCKTFAERRRIVVQNALNIPDEQLSAWSQDSVDGAFEGLKATAKQSAERRLANSKSPMGGAKARVQNSALSSLDRIFGAVRLNNSKHAEDK